MQKTQPAFVLDRVVRTLVVGMLLSNALGLSSPTASVLAAGKPTDVPTATATAISTPTPPDAPALLATATPTATGSPFVTSTSTATGLPNAAPSTHTATVTVTPSGDNEVAPIDDKGGDLVSKDGKVKVHFPPGAVKDKVDASYQALKAPGQLANQPIILYQTFELKATGKGATNNGKAVDKFDTAVTLTVDFTGSLEWPLPRGQQLWIGYYDKTTDTWVQAPFVHDPDAPKDKLTASVQTDHFSTWGFGRTLDAGWLPVYNEPQVALFSGAATFNYPIEVPPGRGGVQPQLNLAFNSRQLDGVLAWTQGGWVGHGWDLDLPSITRDFGSDYNIPGDPGAPGHLALCTDRFHLQIGGAGYTLVAGSQTAKGFRYYTQEESQLYIERRNNGMVANGGSPINVTGEYWIVRDPTGLEYRLGYNADSEFVHRPTTCDYSSPTAGNYGGQNTGDGDPYAAFQWHVDLVTDLNVNAQNVKVNQMTVSYTEEAYCNTSYWRQTAGSEKAVYPNTISEALVQLDGMFE